MADTCPLLTLQPILEKGANQMGAMRSMLEGVLRSPTAGAATLPAPQAQPSSGPPEARTLQHNFNQILEWTQRMCAFVGTAGSGVDGGTP